MRRAPFRDSRAWTWPRSSRTREPYQWNEGSIGQEPPLPLRATQRLHVVAYDYGIKRNILRLLADQGCRTDGRAGDHQRRRRCSRSSPTACSSPTDPAIPEPCDYAIEAIRELLATDMPMFGICLGHQLLGLASGARTVKMKFGHHGANHPVQELASGRVMITSQNHGFAVDEATLPANLVPTHRSLFDGSLQGMARTDRPPSASRAIPEASPGPHDLRPLFEGFIQAMVRRLQSQLRRCAAAARRRARATSVMPKRTDLTSILIIGAGPIVIGQACEFDYSGAQACKALREEGYRVVLVNSNPATIMTDPETADAIYIEPVNWRTVARIIERERPDALLPTMGGQTALNTALDLVREGVLEQYGVELIAASREAIDMAEDREQFRNAMREIGLEVPHSQLARSLEEALAVQSSIGFPIVIRPSFTLGGSGGGIAYNREEFEAIVQRGLDASPTRELLHRGVGARLEGIRDGGGARPQRQLHHHLLDREPRSDGRAHRRLDHRRAGADADRQGISAHARRLDRGAAQDRRGVRRLERAVRDQSGRRPHAGDRDESARVALLGAGLQGDRLSDRQGRRQAGGGLHAR